MTVSGGYGASTSGITDANGYFAISIKPTNLGGPFPLSFAVTSSSGNLNTIAGSITVVKTLAPTLSLALGGSQYIALSGTPVYVTAMLSDQFGNPINGANVTITTPTDSAATINNSTPSGPSGSATGSLTQTTGTFSSGEVGVNIVFDAPGTQTVNASYTVGSQTITEQISIQVSKPITSNIVWTNVSPTTLQAGQDLNISGQALSQVGIGVQNGTPITITVAGSTATFYTHQSGSNYGYFNGQIMVKIAGTFHVQATADGSNFTNYTSINVTAGTPAQLNLSYDGSNIAQIDATSKILDIHVSDQWGNPVSNVTPTLSLNAANLHNTFINVMGGTGWPKENASIVQPSATDQYGNTQITEGRLAIGGDYSYTAELGSLQVTGATFHVNRVVYWMQSEYDNATKIGGTWYANSTLYLIDASGYEIENQPISMTSQSNIIGYTNSSGGITYQAAWGVYYTMYGPAGAGLQGTAQAGYSNIQAPASNTLVIP